MLRATGGESTSGPQPASGGVDADPARTERLHEQRVVTADLSGVLDREVGEVRDERPATSLQRRGDRLLDLEAHQALVTVLIGGAMDLGGRPPELLDHGRHLV